MKKIVKSALVLFCFFIFACNNTMSMLDKADEYYSSGDFAKAEPMYNQVLAKDPGQPHALKGLGNIKLLQKDYPAAIEYYKKTAEVRPELASSELASFLAYQEPGIRKAASDAIVSLNNGKDRVISEVIAQAKNSSPYTMVNYLEALKSAGSSVSAVIADILPLLEHQYGAVKKSALEVLSVADPAKLKEHNAVLKMAQLIKDSDIVVSSAAFKSLSALKAGASEAIPLIIKEFAGSDANKKRAAKAALTEMGPGSKDVIPNLIVFLSSSNVKEIRIAAMDSLASMGANAGDAIYALIPLTQDPDSDIRVITGTTMRKIGAPSESSVLNMAELLKSGNANIQLMAINRLGEMGNAAALAVKPLSELAQTSDNNAVKTEAQKAVAKINQAQK